MSRLIRAGATIATAALLTLAVAPAHADTRYFYDAHDHPLYNDVSRVKVTNGDDFVWVTAEVGTSMIPEDSFYLWLDTDAKNDGPEYRGTVIPNSEWALLRKVGSFSDNGKSIPGCDVMGTADVSVGPTVVWKIKRSCLKNPARIRASVKARYLNGSKIVNDWAPGTNKFFGWVSR